MEMRLIDGNALLDKCENLYMRGNILFHGVTAYVIENAPTIDPETLPIVQATKAMCREMIKENRELSKELDVSRRRSGDLSRELERVTRERDAAVERAEKAEKQLDEILANPNRFFDPFKLAQRED